MTCLFRCTPRGLREVPSTCSEVFKPRTGWHFFVEGRTADDEYHQTNIQDP
jgi:hypothetical protein